MNLNSARMEKLRRARSLNDVLGIGKEVGKDIARAQNLCQIMGIDAQVVTAATSIKFNHSKLPQNVAIGPKKKAQPVASMGAQLTSFKAPNAKEVVKHSTIIHGLQENLYELEAAAAMVRTTFSRVKSQPAAAKALDKLVKDARSTLDAAYASLAFIAKKHLPTEMALLGEELRTFLIDHLNQLHYTNLTTRVYVTVGTDERTPGPLPHKQFSPKTDPKAVKAKIGAAKTRAVKSPVKAITKKELADDIVFAFYIDIEDLKDASGAIISHYYIILTGVIGANGIIRYFLTALPDFQPPGVYHPGVEVTTSTEMLRRLSLLLTANDITSSIERKPMPINTTDAINRGFKLIKNVEDAYVAEDALWVVIKAGFKAAALDKVVDKVIIEVLPLLNNAVGNSPWEGKEIQVKMPTRKNLADPDTIRPGSDSAGTKVHREAVYPRVGANPGRKSIIKYQTVVRKGKTIVKFFLTPNIRKTAEQSAYHINADQLLDLKAALGLPDHVMDGIKKALKRHI